MMDVNSKINLTMEQHTVNMMEEQSNEPTSSNITNDTIPAYSTQLDNKQHTTNMIEEHSIEPTSNKDTTVMTTVDSAQLDHKNKQHKNKANNSILGFGKKQKSDKEQRASADSALSFLTKRTFRVTLGSEAEETKATDHDSDSPEGYQDTEEVLPDLNSYRRDSVFPNDLRQRPTLDALQKDKVVVAPETVSIKVADEKTKATAATKFGWIQGVLVRCLLNIFGVMLFLRLSWVTAQAGIGLATVIILLAAVVTIISTLSMSAICTNGEVKGGGAYYMISRSLGPEFGGAIGVIFSLANAVAAAMYVIGFSETVVDLMKANEVQITDNELNDLRIIGCITSVLLLGVLMIGMEWEAKAQLFLLFVLTVAILNFMIGTFLPPSDEQRSKGFVGYSGPTFDVNFGPDFRGDEGFFTIFAVFFPAATGILAGANISGDLKNPSVAIPKGTLLAIIITSIIYIIMVWMCGATLLRDVPGIICGDAAMLLNMTIQDQETCGCGPGGVQECKYGSENYFPTIGIASGRRELIIAGIFSATLSSALASMIGAPKVFQALARDKVFPGIYFFSKGSGKNLEPKRGYILAFVICIAMVCIAELNIIAPIISNFFLMAYTLINFACFDASISQSPGFRPSFKYYNKWLSLLGALLCLAVMFIINWWAALVTFIVSAALYMYVRQTKPEVNWGSSTQAHAYQDALKSCLRLINIEEHVKNFRPQILLLTGNPKSRPNLIDFASIITRKQSSLFCGHVILGDLEDHKEHLRSLAIYQWFKSKKLKAFYSSVTSDTLHAGVQVLLQTVGTGKLRPNTLMMGYKSDWQMADYSSLVDYINIIHDAFHLNFGVGIFRIPGESLQTERVKDSDLQLKKPSALANYQKVMRSQISFGMANERDTTEYDDGDDWDGVWNSAFDESDEEDGSVSDGVSKSTLDQIVEEDTLPNGHTLSENNAGSEGISTEVPVKTNNVVHGIHSYEELPTQNTNQDTNVGNNVVLPKVPTRTLMKRGAKDRQRRSRPMTQTSHTTIVEIDSARYRNVQNGKLDVWWLADDGGLTILLPHIMSARSIWTKCKLRVFCACSKGGTKDDDEKRMRTLLKKFRIDVSELTILPNLRRKPRGESTNEFNALVEPLKIKPNETMTVPGKLSEAVLLQHKDQTNRNLRLRELLKLHSAESAQIVMTMPVPKKKTIPPVLYMCWLEMLTRDMPPTLLLRGNQQSVLTYSS